MELDAGLRWRAARHDGLRQGHRAHLDGDPAMLPAERVEWHYIAPHPLRPRQHATGRVRIEIHTGKTGRMRPEMKRKLSLNPKEIGVSVTGRVVSAFIATALALETPEAASYAKRRDTIATSQRRTRQGGREVDDKAPTQSVRAILQHPSASACTQWIAADTTFS